MMDRISSRTHVIFMVCESMVVSFYKYASKKPTETHAVAYDMVVLSL